MSSQSPKPLKIFIFAVDGVGHLNACVGMAQALVKRGHRIFFLQNDAFAGQFSKFGFDEILLKSTPQGLPPGAAAGAPPTGAGAPKRNPVKEMAEHLIKSGMLSAKSPVEKLRDQLKDGQAPAFMDKIYNTLVEHNPQIADAIELEKPDLFIVDHFIIPPAVPLSGIPWLFLFSGNPLTLYGSDKLPPFGAGKTMIHLCSNLTIFHLGYATDSDPATWQEMAELQKKRMDVSFVQYQKKINALFNYVPPEVSDAPKMLFGGSPYLNIYGYPEELDYHDIVPRPDKIAHVDAFIREVPEPFELPEEFVNQPGKLIYVSLGSMGSVDVDLMKRITSALARTSHKYIVSKGPRADEYELPSNCWGEGYLPQTRILPLVDLVLTHGGNNTITETFSCGKPMIVLPLFADQCDNAQRVTEKGYGARLEPYAFTEDELINTIDRLLNDKEMNARGRVAAERIANSNSKEKVCQVIEKLVEDFNAHK